MRWCMDPEEPECNGPDCGHADSCSYYKEMMEEDPSAAEALAEYNRKKEKAGAMGKGDMKRRRAYVKSTTVCPACGRNAVMRLFKCRCANWYGYYALRFYCKNKECPVDHVCTEFFPDRESAEKRMNKYMAKESEVK